MNVPETKDKELNMKLKRFTVNIFCNDTKITQNNRNNMQRLINGIKNDDLKKELTRKLENCEEGKHHRSQVK
jgi:hypothetical protein